MPSPSMIQGRVPSASQVPNMEALFNPSLGEPMAKDSEPIMFGAMDTVSGISDMPTLAMSISPQQILLQQNNGSDFSLDFF